MFIDSHQHYWQIGRHGHEWPTADLTQIYRDFVVQDIEQAASGLQLAGTVVVQSQPSDADTEWLLQLAVQHTLIKGIVGWLDLASDDAVLKLRHLKSQPKFRGVRPMLQSLPDDSWILRNDVQPALMEIVHLELCFDALVFTRQLSSIAELAQRYPDMRVVIDHAAKPPIAQRDVSATKQWRDSLASVAKHSNVHCKLSGLFTEMHVDQPRDEAIPYVEHVFDVFGWQRVMWGSDWPVLLLRNGYASWHDWVCRVISRFDSAQQQCIMHGNACRFYSL